MVKLSEAILNGDARAYGKLSDLMRVKGARYREVVALIKKIHVEAGRAEPSDADIEDKFTEADNLESRS